jgi:hypothetical protein
LQAANLYQDTQPERHPGLDSTESPKLNVPSDVIDPPEEVR